MSEEIVQEEKKKRPSKKKAIDKNELVRCTLIKNNVVVDRKKGKGKEIYQPRWRAVILQDRGYLKIEEE